MSIDESHYQFCRHRGAGGAVGVNEIAVTALAVAKLVSLICMVVVPGFLSFAIIVGKR